MNTIKMTGIQDDIQTIIDEAAGHPRITFVYQVHGSRPILRTLNLMDEEIYKDGLDDIIKYEREVFRKQLHKNPEYIKSIRGFKC